MNASESIGFLFILLFFVLILVFQRIDRGRFKHYLREIPAFTRLRKGIGLAVEAGQRLHISLGHGGVSDVNFGSGLIGLSLLQRIARAASMSDRPPVATSGETTLAILSQDSLKSIYQSMRAEGQYDPVSGNLTGLTPFSFAAGAIPVLHDQHVAMNVISGHFNVEVALIADAAERNSSLTLAGSDHPQAQAVLYAAAQEPLIGEELYASGAYLQVNPTHLASVKGQDVMRWVLVGSILTGIALKVLGIL